MVEIALQFDESDIIGRVASVDTSRVVINVTDATRLTRVAVGNIAAVRGTMQHEYLIGIIDRVTRTIQQSSETIDRNVDDDLSLQVVGADNVRLSLIGTYRSVYGSSKNRFKRGADSFPQVDRECYLVSGPNLQRLMGLLAQHVPDDARLELGRYVADDTAAAIADGDRLFQRHAAILGSTGSGKSWAVARLLESTSKLLHPNVIVLDMHGEYYPLTHEVNGFAAGFRVAGPGDLKAPTDNVLFLPYWLLNREEMLAMVLDRTDENAPNQAARFTDHVRGLKETTLKREGRDEVLATFTVDSPVPYDLSNLVAELYADDTRKGEGKTGPVKGVWEGKLTRFIARLKAKAEDRRYGFMFQPPPRAMEYEWLAQQLQALLGTGTTGRGIKIVDFSLVPADVLPVVVALFARLLYDVQFWMDRSDQVPFAVVCDEAHLYLPVKSEASAVERQALGVFERIAKEGRKYGVSLLVVSQRPSDVSRTILSQCNNFIALRLTNDEDQSVVRRLMPDSMSGLADMLPLLDTGEALVLGDAVLLPTRVKLARPTIEPASATRNFWTDWQHMQARPDAIASAVESLRRQTKPAAEP